MSFDVQTHNIMVTVDADEKSYSYTQEAFIRYNEYTWLPCESKYSLAPPFISNQRAKDQKTSHGNEYPAYQGI